MPINNNNDLKKIQQNLNKLTDPLKISPLQGKMLRPKLMLLIASSLKIASDQLLPYATLVELIHQISLIHDDVIDQAALRRQKMSCNILLGNKRAILLGDYLLCQALQLINKLPPSPPLHLLPRIVAKMTLIELEYKKTTTLSELKRLHLHKTAHLFAWSAYLPAALHFPSLASSYYRLGINIGMIYQALDDLNDYQKDNSNNLLKIFTRKKKEQKYQASDRYIDTLYHRAVQIINNLPSSKDLLTYLDNIMQFKTVAN